MPVTRAQTPPRHGIPRIDICGHSSPGGGGTTYGDHNAYPERLAKMLGARKRANIAQGGAVACWPSANASSDGGWGWVLSNFLPPNAGDGTGGYLPNTTVAVVHHGFEDLAALGHSNPGAFQHALATEIAAYCASAVYLDNDASWAYAGTWSSYAAGQAWPYRNGQCHYTTTSGATATWTVPSDYPGNLVCGIGLAVVPGTLGAGATITLNVTVDGTSYGNLVLSLDKGGVSDAENGKTNMVTLRLGRSDCGLGLPTAQGGLAIPALGAGSHTIKLTYSAGTAGAYFIVNFAHVEADPLDGPVVVVPSSYRATSYSAFSSYMHGPSASTDPITDSSVTAWNTSTQQVCTNAGVSVGGVLAGGFPGRCVFVNLDNVINKNPSYLATDGIHTSNRGHAMIAQAIHDAIVNSGYLTARVRSRTSITAFPIAGTQEYDGGIWRPIGGGKGTAIGVPLQNSWVWYQGNTPPPGYRRQIERGVVELRGALSGGSSASAQMFTWQGSPPGYGYLSNYIVDRMCEGGLGAVTMRTDQNTNVWAIANGSTTYTVLSGHEWPAEA